MRALPAPVEFGADDAQLLGQVADYYAATLKQSPEALAAASDNVKCAIVMLRAGVDAAEGERRLLAAAGSVRQALG